VAKAAKPMFHISVPDGIPFESDEAAVAHVLSKHLDKFFDTAEVDVDPPKGNFQVINKCGITGELLGRQTITATIKLCSSTTRPRWQREWALRPFAVASKRSAIRSGEPMAREDEEDHALHVEIRLEAGSCAYGD
jgi:hypothetical protein